MSLRRLALAAAIVAVGGCNGADGNDAAAKADENQVARTLAQVEIRPGLWEVSSEIVSARQPQLPHEIAERMKGRRRTVRHCITPEQAAQPDANFLAGRDGANCSHQRFEMRGGRIESAMTCRDPGGVETRARMTGRYGPESYDMQMEIETPGIGRDVTMTVVTRQTARRFGDCPQQEEQQK